MLLSCKLSSSLQVKKAQELRICWKWLCTLQQLNCSGTQVSDLTPLASLTDTAFVANRFRVALHRLRTTLGRPNVPDPAHAHHPQPRNQAWPNAAASPGCCRSSDVSDR